MEANQPSREEFLSLLVQNAALAASGSFSDRNPTLGKMKTCPYCGYRRRQFGGECCNPKYIATNLADVPKSLTAKKRKNPRLTRNRPPLLEVHEKLLLLERDPNYVEVEGISGMVEAQIMRGRREKRNKRNRQQRNSRKANRRKV